MPSAPTQSLSDLDRRCKAAIDRMSKANPNRRLLEDLMSCILSLALEKRPEVQRTGDEAV